MAITDLFRKVHNSALLVGISRRQTGHGFRTQSSPVDLSGLPVDLPADPGLRDTSTLANQGGSVGRLEALPPDNPDPLKPSVSLKPAVTGIRYQIRQAKSTLRRWYRYMRPELTADQLEEKQRLDQERRFDRLMKKEGIKYARLLSEKYAQLGYRYINPLTHRKIRVRFDKIAYNDNGTVIQLHATVNPAVLPEGVRLIDLTRPENVNELLPTIGHPARVMCDIEGLIVEIQRAGKEGLPDFITIAELWAEMPENKPPLTFPAGIAENGRRVWLDLDDCPHLLVAGSTKQGKSNMINGILCSFIRRLAPDQVQLVLFDLKQGMEFGFYEGLPHLYQDLPTVETIDKTLPALDKLERIMQTRMERIRKAGFKSANDYNLRHYGKNRMPHLVVVFDEWGTIALTPGIGKQAEAVLTKIANQARAAGIYIILGTQNPRADVVSTLIKLNFSVRFAFSVDMPGSMAILSNQRAVGLPCRGRAVLSSFGDMSDIQTPRITDDLIRATVHKAITGKDIKAEVKVDVTEILQWSLDNMDGMLSVNRLFQKFKGTKITHEQLKRVLREAEGQEFVLSGSKYLVKAASGKNGRMLSIIS